MGVIVLDVFRHFLWLSMAFPLIGVLGLFEKGLRGFFVDISGFRSICQTNFRVRIHKSKLKTHLRPFKGP